MSPTSSVKYVPFDEGGNLMDYVEDPKDRPLLTRADVEAAGGRAGPHIAAEWRRNDLFAAVLEIEGFGRGRSAAYFEWSDGHGHVYTMFLTDMVDLLKRGTIKKGRTGNHLWNIAKRGKNYGIKLVQI